MKYRPANSGGRVVFRQPSRRAQVSYLLQRTTGRRSFGYRFVNRNYYKRARYGYGTKTSRLYNYGRRYRR